MLLFPVKAHPSLNGLIAAPQGERASLEAALLKWNVRLIKNPVIAENTFRFGRFFLF
jgi:hypothetical protein